MGSHEASKVTLESIRQRMLEVERVHRRGKKMAVSDTLIKDIGWLFRRIGFLTNQVRTLESELEGIIKEKKELSDDNIMTDKVKMLMERLQDNEDKLRIAQSESRPYKRENNSLRQEIRLIKAQAHKAERRAKDLFEQLTHYKNIVEGVEEPEGDPAPQS